jgi:hypothetical protein
MKIKSYLCAASLAALLLQGSAWATQEKQSAAQARNSNTAPTSETDDSSFAWRVARYPGRVGHSVMRSPMIVGETLSGKRTLINTHGLFKTADEPTSTDQRNSIPQGRGQRLSR